MKSVTEKINTLRIATATSTLVAKPETIVRMKENDLPKKDVLIVARVAAVNAVKKTPDLIPYCHPLPVDSVKVEFEVKRDSVIATVTVEAIWKTGVEIEALAGAQMATLTIYDMLKPVDKEMEITTTKLLSKKGGKTSFNEKLPAGFKAAVIVSSDGTASGKREDKSGKIIKERLESFGIEPAYEILPDEKELIQAKIKELCDEGVLLILTTGGTGLGPRDVTVEATQEMIDREIPGIVEAARSYGQQRTPYAMLSRGLAGQRGNTIIINLPGSSNGVRESLNAIFPAILHSYKMMKGLGH